LAEVFGDAGLDGGLLRAPVVAGVDQHVRVRDGVLALLSILSIHRPSVDFINISP
jgi:hypothetical protein